MLFEFSQVWWILLVKGIGAILLGVAAFISPEITLLVVMLAFGVFAIFDGMTSFIFGFAGRERNESMWPMIISGLTGLGAGIITLFWPGLTALALLAIIAGWSIIQGAFELVAAIKLREVIEDEWLLGLSGFLSIAFGSLLVFWPAAGLMSLIWLIGSFAIIFGIVAVALSFRLKDVHYSLKHEDPILL